MFTALGLLAAAAVAFWLRYGLGAGVADVYTYPEASELREIEQELLPAAVADDPIFDQFPVVESDRARLRWVQKDNYQGLQQIRGLNGAPRVVRLPGAKVFDMEPGVYGEFAQLDEKELTERRELASWDEPINLDEMVGDAQALLLQRRLDRIRYIIWTLLTAGVFSVPNGEGAILQTDTFPLKTLTAAVPWTTYATATPSADIRAAQLLSLGQSVDFGAGAELWMNRVTANALLQNQNANDIFGRRVNAGETVNSMSEVNRLLEANDLPQIVIYDRFYIDDAGTPQRFIPSGKVVLIGRRTNGAKLGEYRMTRNANNPRMEPGAYTKVIDTGETGVPRTLHVHDGHNGGPVIFFPGAIVVITAF
jgi:hypothetical protein